MNIESSPLTNIDVNTGYKPFTTTLAVLTAGTDVVTPVLNTGYKPFTTTLAVLTAGTDVVTPVLNTGYKPFTTTLEVLSTDAVDHVLTDPHALTPVDTSDKFMGYYLLLLI
jgi:hypothetical protein